jgi:hypothetical protein
MRITHRDIQAGEAGAYLIEEGPGEDGEPPVSGQGGKESGGNMERKEHGGAVGSLVVGW